ncbi:hypothetical protein HY750_03010 [Candidatus Kuenenbacteria bacterium]|nr:hypothetical protein [Candidatus Kuenenbacteria bacterium]
MIKNNNKQKWINPYTDSLLKVILKLKNLNEAHKFFRDLFTEKEILEFGQRWRVAKMLNNNVPYTKIEKETCMSSTTIARIHKWLKKGMGGYKLMIKKLKN